MVTTFYPPYNFGGDGIQVWRLANALAKKNHEVHVIHCKDAYRMFAPEPVDDSPNHPNVTLHGLKSFGGWLSPALTQQTGFPLLKTRTIKRIFAENKFDVIHYHNISLFGPGVLKLGAAIKLFTLHEHWLMCPMHVLWKFDREVCESPSCFSCQLRGRRPPQWWRYTGLLKRSLKHVDAFIAPSLFTLQKHRDWGIDRRIAHIPHFVPESPVLEDLESPHPRPFFFSVGRLEKLKGVQVLIEAFRQYQGADLLIAGDGGYASFLRDAAKNLPNVVFLGRRNMTELANYYRHAIATLVPSLTYEVFGMVIVESFQQKTPVIAHDLGPLGEITREAQGGLTYKSPAELIRCLETLQNDPQRRNELGQNGYESFLQQWNEQAYLCEYIHLVESIPARQ